MHLKTSVRSLSACVALATLTVSPLRGASLTGGSANFNFDPAAWASVAGGANSPGFEALKLNEVFNQAAANARTGAQILSDEIVANPSPTGIVFDLNGPVVSNLSLRYTQPTDFAFTPGNLTGHTGQIGLGGVTRWDVNPLLGGGSLVFGDFTLSYDATRQLVGGTGWALKANIPPAGVAFDLLNVTTSYVGETLSISGDLGISFEVANFLFANPADQGRDVGDFSFAGTTAAPVPEPASIAWVTGTACLVLALRRRMRA